MNGRLHIAPVLHLPDPDILVEDVTLTVEATHRVLAPHKPVVRKAHSFDEFAIAGLRDSVFGWTIDLAFEATLRPLTFQLNWSVRIEDRDRLCQHRLTVSPKAASGVKDPLWSTDASLWPNVGGEGPTSAYCAPFSVFTQSQLLDEMQRDLTITARPHITTIVETLSVPAIERGEMADLMSDRYSVAASVAA